MMRTRPNKKTQEAVNPEERKCVLSRNAFTECAYHAHHNNTISLFLQDSRLFAEITSNKNELTQMHTPDFRRTDFREV